MSKLSTKKIAKANPTKRFFVDMLTRDIELGDAILDLLDNCIDGVLRKINDNQDLQSSSPYSGFEANITLNENYFQIVDNCGGMSLNLAENYAFRFGRPDDSRDVGIPTVGVYGIGMKRALFKIGLDSVIESRHEDTHFKVHITPKWLTQDVEWELPIDIVKDDREGVADGVTITINKLHKGIQKSFDPSAGNFAVPLKELIKTHYAYILKKGFKVTVNGEKITPADMRVLVDKTSSKQKISPYVYQAEYDGVKVEMVLGMYEKFATEDESEEMLYGIRSRSTAGWTIICNDRIVLNNDTTHLTGWGEAGVPAYHSQFIAISGVVKFISSDASKLPVTTTKRGIDQNSELYSSVKDIMREALKHFTSFTNQWKSQTEERVQMQKSAQSVELQEAVQSITKWTEVRKGIGGKRFIPNLPKPNEVKKHNRIAFNRQTEDINIVRTFIFNDDESITPSQVGEAAFDYVLSEAK